MKEEVIRTNGKKKPKLTGRVLRRQSIVRKVFLHGDHHENNISAPSKKIEIQVIGM